MATTVTAQDNSPSVVVSESGGRGKPGRDGTDGSGFNQVSLTKLNNALFQGFQPNRLVTASAPNGDETDVIHTRASTATYIDRYGVLKTAGIDELRETAGGYQIEAVGSTNAWDYSEDFTHSSWVKNSIRVELSPADDLSNLLAYKIIPRDWQDIKSIVKVYESVAGDTQSMTFIIKAAELGILHLGSNNSQSSAYYLSKINLFDGSIISGGGNITQFRKIEKGAYIVTVTFPTENGGVGSPTIQILSNNQEQNWTSNDSDGIIFYAGQIENKATPSSYIPTTDAPATRAPDIVHTAYENNVPRGDQPYTIIFKGIVDGYTSFNRLFGTESNNVTSRLNALIGSEGVIFHYNGNDELIARTSDPITFGEEFTYIITSDGVIYTSYLDGVLQTSSNVINPAIELPSELRVLQGYSSSSNSNGKCSLFKTLPYAITADEAKLI